MPGDRLHDVRWGAEFQQTAFATNTGPGGPGRQLADLELRHRRRARAEDRIRVAKDTGLRNLPLYDLDQDRIWCALVALACELTAWAQLLAFPAHPARRWELKRLRLRIFSLAGRLTRTARRTVLHLPAHAPVGRAAAPRAHHPARAPRTQLTAATAAPTTPTARPLQPREHRPRPVAITTALRTRDPG